MPDAIPVESRDKDTTARYVIKTKLYVLGQGGRQGVLDVSCRDINKAFAENQLLVEMYNTIFLVRFFDKIYAKVNIEGKEFNTESREPENFSSRFFLPGRGRIYTVDDVRGKTDETSMELMARMATHNIKAGFLDNTTNLMVPAELENGDRILDETEINDFGQKTLAPSQEAKPKDPASIPEPEISPEIKKLIN